MPKCRYCNTRLRAGDMCTHCREKYARVKELKALLNYIVKLARIEKEGKQH